VSYSLLNLDFEFETSLLQYKKLALGTGIVKSVVVTKRWFSLQPLYQDSPCHLVPQQKLLHV
jgi:hypothetical protein